MGAKRDPGKAPYLRKATGLCKNGTKLGTRLGTSGTRTDLVPLRNKSLEQEQTLFQSRSISCSTLKPFIYASYSNYGTREQDLLYTIKKKE